MHIITGQVLCGLLISSKGFIPSVLRSNLIFLRSLEKSNSCLRSKCFHCLPSAGCQKNNFKHRLEPSGYKAAISLWTKKEQELHEDGISGPLEGCTLRMRT
jgi:hypothetical protein